MVAPLALKRSGGHTMAALGAIKFLTIHCAATPEGRAVSADLNEPYEVRFDREKKPGVSNLLEILAAATGRAPADVAADYTQYGALKTATGEAVIELLRPIQARYHELVADRGELAALLHKGRDKARTVAAATLDRAYRRLGLLA